MSGYLHGIRFADKSGFQAQIPLIFWNDWLLHRFITWLSIQRWSKHIIIDQHLNRSILSLREDET